MTRYYKLFDLLNRTGKKKSDLREFLSPKTVAKLTKGEYVSGEVIDKICLFLKCQPSDIMEVFEIIEIPNEDGTTRKLEFKHELENEYDLFINQLREDKKESYQKIKEEMKKRE